MRSVLLAAILLAPLPLAAQTPAQILVRKAIEAQGGEAALRAVRSVQIEGMGHSFALEQSERPEGPHMVSYEQLAEIRDQEHGRLWRRREQRNWSAAQWTGGAMVVDGDTAAARVGEQWRPHQPQQVERAREDLDLAPERLLLTVLAAPDLRVAPDRALHGILNHAVSFTYGGHGMTLYLNSHTMLPTMLRVVSDDIFGIWGDVTSERWYTFWTLQPGGWQLPQQVSQTWNGVPEQDHTVLTVRVNEAVDETLFAIPEETRAAFRKLRAGPAPAAMGLQALRLDSSKAIDVADNVVVFPGAWAVTLVRQPDGIVVLEAPIGSAYSVQVIDAAAARFPGVPIKAVVTTSDAWPHLGGVREYVARGIPVYALDLNLPILRRLVSAPRSSSPDALARAPRKPIWKEVGAKTTIGTGATRIDVIPVRGEGSERMMIAHLPALNLLYASDLLQYARDRKSLFNPIYPAEAAAALTREGITGVDRVWAMHMDPIPWSTVAEALSALRAAR